MNLEPLQNESIRKEIGYRLSMLLAQGQESTPKLLLELLRQLSSIDRDPINESSFGPKALIEHTDEWLRNLLLQQERQLRERLQYEPERQERNELEALLAKVAGTLNGASMPAQK